MITARKGLSLMLIDNDRHVRESLKVFFEGGPQAYLIFKTAEQGLNALKYQQVDVVVSDYFLPDMDGLEFLNEAARIQPGIHRILMATISSDDLEKEIQKAGVDRFIEKPLTVATLDKVLNDLENQNFQTSVGDKNE